VSEFLESVFNQTQEREEKVTFIFPQGNQKVTANPTTPGLLS
jgi:hypothetical protein